LTITRNVLVPLLEGFSHLCLTPLCGSSFIAFKVGVFVEGAIDCYEKKGLHELDDQELWIMLKKFYPNDSEEVISYLGCFIKSRKKQIEAAVTVQIQLEIIYRFYQSTYPLALPSQHQYYNSFFSS
jgi:hypothetical protein